MEVTIGEEVTEIAWPTVGDDHLLDLDFGAGGVDDGSERFFVGRMEDMPSPEFLKLKRRRTVGVVLQMQKNASGVHGGGWFRQRWLGVEGFSAGKLWKKIGRFIPAGGEAVVESA